MPLVDVRGFDVQSQALPRFQLGQQQGLALQQAQQQAGRKAQIQQLLGKATQPVSPQVTPEQLGTAAPSAATQQLGAQPAVKAPIIPQPTAPQQPLLNQSELIRQARLIDPAFADQQLKAMGLDEPSKRAEASRFAARVQSLPLEQQDQAITQRAESLRQQGRDPKDTLQLLDLQPDQRTQALQGVQLLDLSTKERFGITGTAQKASESAIKADLKASETEFDRAQKLRGELTKATTEFKKVESSFERVKASTGGTAASDLSLVFNFMKMNDPGSTVREGEFATAQNSAGVPGRIVSLYNNLLEGTRLNPAQRKDFSDQSESLFKSAEKLKNRDEKRILSIGEQFNVKKSLILGEELEPEVSDLTVQSLQDPSISIEQLQAEAAKLRGQ